MTRILFVCHGNICRSPMAEFAMKELVKKAGIEDQFQIASAATSAEEVGNPGTAFLLGGTPPLLSPGRSFARDAAFKKQLTRAAFACIVWYTGVKTPVYHTNFT